MFISFDGIDGVGKTTQMDLFCQWLESQNHAVVACRDPGSTELGEALRALVLERHAMAIDRMSEMLIYMAARAQMVQQVIRPALVSGKSVVSDRFLLANIVYQGHAGGLDVEQVRQVGAVATAGVVPDLTILLDMDVEDAVRRMNRSLDRIEAQGTEYLAAVREGFLREAARDPASIVVINACGEVDDVQLQIRKAAKRILS